MIGRKFYKTKLCKLYRNGRCHRQSCSFAHGAAELRRSPVGGRRDYRSGDLRDRLEHRQSPYRRYSLERDGRGHNASSAQKLTSRGNSLSRSPPRQREGKHKGRQNFNGHNDDSGSYKTNSDAEDHEKADRALPDHEKDELEEELKHLQMDIQKLEDDKKMRKNILEEKDDQANRLSSRIKDLETHLTKEQEDCRRISSKVKKFIRAHGRYLKAQDELKRSQARLQRVGTQLGLDTSKPLGNEDSSVNGLSEEDAGDHRTTARNDELQNNASSMKKRAREVSQMHDDRRILSSSKKGRTSGLEIRSEKLSVSGFLPQAGHNSKDIEASKANSIRKGNLRSFADENHKQRKSISAASSLDKVKGVDEGHMLPPTSMDIHAVDELSEATELDRALHGDDETHDDRPKLAYDPPLPPKNMQNAYEQYEGDDEDVDVEKVDTENVDTGSDVDI